MQWQLYSSTRSPFVRKAMIAAHETGLAGRLQQVMVTTTPMAPASELAGLNPLGMIPTLVAGEEVLFDSAVILEFFDSEAPRGLIPAAGSARRDCLTRQAMADGMMDKAVKILDEQFRKQNDDTKEHLAGHIAAQRRTIDWFALRLEAQRFDAGDIALYAALSYLDLRFPEIFWRDGQDGVAAWFAQHAARPSVLATPYQMR
jgi:glutathione S-transferase